METLESKPRTCLSCQRFFDSLGAQNRICPKCLNTRERPERVITVYEAGRVVRKQLTSA